jgi:hypothetical protein
LVKTLAFILGLLPSLAVADCRLALLLALDVSSSVDDAEYLMQVEGVADALVSEDVQAAILSGGGGSVALSVYEWSGRYQSAVILDWVVLRNASDIETAAQTVRQSRRTYERFPTALGYALGFGAGHLKKAPACARKVIDVSGDGITNDGFWPDLAYMHFPFEGVTVNGLAVLGADPDVLDHYMDEVRRGPGSFVETAQGYEGYARAMERKLYREIENRIVGQSDTAEDAPG